MVADGGFSALLHGRDRRDIPQRDMESDSAFDLRSKLCFTALTRKADIEWTRRLLHTDHRLLHLQRVHLRRAGLAKQSSILSKQCWARIAALTAQT